jgi:hypothetical protein
LDYTNFLAGGKADPEYVMQAVMDLRNQLHVVTTKPKKLSQLYKIEALPKL